MLINASLFFVWQIFCIIRLLMRLGFYYALQIIVDAGVDVNIRDARNATPLQVALGRGANQCVGLLLEREADCNLQVYK